MYKPFFPNLEFAWAFCAALVGLLAVASVVDLRRMVIPKWLTLPLLAAGLLASVARGAWLGHQGEKLWLLSTDSAWLGGLDGLLFALTGVVCSFGMMFLLWILGTCGGGDVKLLAALGAWVGPLYALFVLAVSLVVLLVLVIVKALSLGVTPRNMQAMMKANRRKGEQPPKPSKMRITYSLPVAVATTLVLLWVFRVELHLAAPKQPTSPRGQAHARF